MAGGGGGIVERAHSFAFQPDAADIDIGDQQFGVAVEPLRFGDQLAEFVDLPLAVPREVGGALARPRGRIDVRAHAARRLRRGEHRAFARLADDDVRSEEHTSELQSLMRISYAVFCLKKKTTT